MTATPTQTSALFQLEALETEGFSWRTAFALACASKLAYEPARVVESIARDGWGFEHVHFFDAGESQAFYARAGELGVLAFRGTESLGDWLGNLDVGPAASPFGPGQVHLGFLLAYLAVRAEVRDALDSAGFPRRLLVTGHSLGGALAALAAADLATSERMPGAVYTFGQPRLGDSAFGAAYLPRPGGCHFRFVNDDDVVPRVPPGWRHVGRLIHFDEHGSLRGGEASEAAGEAGPEPLSAAEFEHLQQALKSVARALRKSPVGESAGRTLDASAEGIVGGIGDHRIDRYIDVLRRQLPATARDATIGLEAVQRPSSSAAEAVPLGKERTVDVPVVIRVKSPDWKPPEGVTVNSRIGSFVSARIPADLLNALAADGDVLAVEASRDGFTAELARSVPFVGADALHRPPIDERGDAALVGVIDGGIDIVHDAFTDARGSTRIVAIWNQRDCAGPSPRQLDAACFQPDYGSVYGPADIAAMRQGARSIPRPLRDAGDGHGTHVTSIAAGRGVGGCAEGMAPEAGIVVVIPNMVETPGDPPSVGYSVSHMDALHFLLGVARGGNALLREARPIAINVSQGMNAGAHDGTSLLEGVFDSATGKGRDAGCVIVKSAGNERGFGGHARVRAAQSSVVDVTWQSSGFRFQDYIEAWYDAADELEFSLADPAGNVSAVVSRANPSLSATLGGNTCRLELAELHRDNGDNRLALFILPATQPIQSGTWTLSIVGSSVRSREGWVDFWVEREQSRAVTFNPQEPKVTLSIPGTADTVITVGACSSGDPVRLAPFSSFGRTRRDGPKPDLCAPGLDIVAARAGGPDPTACIAMSGTSMAAPHVTGALALALSRRHKTKPAAQYNAQQLRQALNRTVRNRAGFHHEGFGWGVLDALALYNLLR